MANTATDLVIQIAGSPGGTPQAATAEFMSSVQTVDVTHHDEGRSGFQIVLQAPRTRSSGAGYLIASDPQVQVFNRVLISVKMNGTQVMLMDGVITHQQLKPGTTPGGSLFTVTGEDLSVLMDMQEKVVAHPALDEASIATSILGAYSQYGIAANVQTPSYVDTPSVNQYLPVQRGTDLAYLREMATRFGFVFFLDPGPSSGSSSAYWGPPIVTGSEQPALSVDVGPATNVDSINLRYDALAAATRFGSVQDSITNVTSPISITSASAAWPSLTSSAALSSQAMVRSLLSKTNEAVLQQEATGRTQADVDYSTGRVAAAEGELDATRYGAVLKARALVGLRGVSSSFDGTWYVKKVTHVLKTKSYKQSFTLTRDGLGANQSTVSV